MQHNSDHDVSSPNQTLKSFRRLAS